MNPRYHRISGQQDSRIHRALQDQPYSFIFKQCNPTLSDCHQVKQDCDCLDCAGRYSAWMINWSCLIHLSLDRFRIHLDSQL